MSEWRPIKTAPRDGTPVLLGYSIESNDVHGYAPWDVCPVVIGWWSDGYDKGWVICFMRDGSADSYGVSSQFFQVVPEKSVKEWMPLPDHKRKKEEK